MDQITIRCHPVVPVAVEELHRWLEREADALRMETPHGTVRLSRLEQSRPSGTSDVGWLLELGFPDGQLPLYRARLAATMTDLHLLGLQTTLLRRLGISGESATAREAATRIAGRAAPAGGTRS